MVKAGLVSKVLKDEDSIDESTSDPQKQEKKIKAKNAVGCESLIAD